MVTTYHLVYGPTHPTSHIQHPTSNIRHPSFIRRPHVDASFCLASHSPQSPTVPEGQSPRVHESKAIRHMGLKSIASHTLVVERRAACRRALGLKSWTLPDLTCWHGKDEKAPALKMEKEDEGDDGDGDDDDDDADDADELTS